MLARAPARSLTTQPILRPLFRLYPLALYGLLERAEPWPAAIARVARGSEGISQAFPSAQPTS